MRRFNLIGVLLLSVLALTGCGDKMVLLAPVDPPRPPIATVMIAPASVTLAVGDSAVLSVTATYPAESGPFTWSSSDSTRAAVAQTGVVRAIAKTAGIAICAQTRSANRGCA